ncbi:sel1 repeat family protein [Nocardia altamirensis]|uniref:sel1 repeat family protein n=1 Tax=Nocardia altamirensis TaxID=472158 RepID=UPI00083FE3F1|nr:sel1 repeat family protein [Nocardia altamirensis]
MIKTALIKSVAFLGAMAILFGGAAVVSGYVVQTGSDLERDRALGLVLLLGGIALTAAGVLLDRRFQRVSRQVEGGTLLYRADLACRRGDLTDAEIWYRRAADLGNTDAMTHLGHLLFAEGELAEAEFWYSRAAARGNDDAVAGIRRVMYHQHAGRALPHCGCAEHRNNGWVIEFDQDRY